MIYLVFYSILDYFLNLHSFQEIISSLYKINEIIQKRNALLLIHINSDLLPKELISVLKEEIYDHHSEKFDEISIDKDLYEILKFINEKNVNNIIVSFKEIGIKFVISKITVSKKINKIINLDLVKSSKSGRAKVLHLTTKGMNLIKIK